jgi:uncharacterized membrane protein YkoI
MKFRVLLSFCLLITGAQWGLPAIAFAQPPAAEQEVQEQVIRGGLTQRQALDRVRERFPGNVISINEVRQGERVRFRIRIDNEGNIYTVYVDKASGAITRE